jgi:uncharacterized protein YaaN involved in tellurite resistance
VLEEQISENYQRGILDLESLETVNQLTIETLNNTLSRVKEGREQRAHAQTMIEQAEQELKANSRKLRLVADTLKAENIEPMFSAF